MSDPVSDPIFTAKIKEEISKIEGPIAEIKQFALDLTSQRQKIEQLNAEYLSAKDSLEQSISGVEKLSNTYAQIKADVDQKVSHIINTNAQVDEIKGRIDAADRNIGDLKAKIESDAHTVEVAKNKFDTLKDETEKISVNLTTKQTNLNSQISKIEGKAAALKQLEENLAALKSSAELAKNEAEAANQKIQQQQQVFDQSILQTNQKLTDLINQQTALQTKITEIIDNHEEISLIHSELLLDKEDSNGNLVTRSIETQIMDLLENSKEQSKVMAAMGQKQREDFEQLYLELKGKIESLLPGAAATGLGSSYYSAKLRYSITDDVTSSEGDLKDSPIFSKGFQTQFASLLLNYGLFIVPLGFAAWEFWGVNPASSVGKDIGIWEALVFKLSVTLPCLIISGFGLASILSNKRLYEEYNYKQRVMQLYHGFKDEIESTNNEDLKIKLLNMMLEVVKSKPASKDKGTKIFFPIVGKPIEKVIEKFSDPNG